MAHILLIDDDPALIPKQVRMAFPRPTHRVDVARTCSGGLGLVHAEPPVVILLDLRLPTGPAWRSTGRWATSTRASRSSS